MELKAGGGGSVHAKAITRNPFNGIESDKRF